VTENTLARWERGTVGVSAAVARLIRFVEAERKKGR